MEDVSLHECRLPSCPHCGGMLVLAEMPRGERVVWCTRCERSYEPTRFIGRAGIKEGK